DGRIAHRDDPTLAVRLSEAALADALGGSDRERGSHLIGVLRHLRIDAGDANDADHANTGPEYGRGGAAQINVARPEVVGLVDGDSGLFRQRGADPVRALKRFRPDRAQPGAADAEAAILLFLAAMIDNDAILVRQKEDVT